MSSQWKDAFNEAVERRVRMLQAAEDELMRAHRRDVTLDDLTEIDRRRLMHERIRQAEAERDALLYPALILADALSGNIAAPDVLLAAVAEVQAHRPTEDAA